MANKATKETPVEEQSTGLIPIEEASTELFTVDGSLRSLLDRIEQQVSGLVFDITTDEGRKECKSVAYNVARSKTAIEDAGKNLVAGWKEKAKVVDNLRKESREFLTDLQARVRRPVTEWEEEQARIAQEEADAAKLIADEEEAYEMDAHWENERELREARAELARVAEENRQRELKERLEKEAREAATRDAQAQIDRANQQARDAEERGRRQAQEQHDREERERLAKEAAEKAEREEREEAERLKKEDQEYRQSVNRAALETLVKFGIDAEVAKTILRLVISGKVPQIKMEY